MPEMIPPLLKYAQPNIPPTFEMFSWQVKGKIATQLLKYVNDTYSSFINFTMAYQLKQILLELPNGDISGVGNDIRKF